MIIHKLRRNTLPNLEQNINNGVSEFTRVITMVISAFHVYHKFIGLFVALLAYSQTINAYKRKFLATFILFFLVIVNVLFGDKEHSILLNAKSIYLTNIARKVYTFTLLLQIIL